MRAQISVSGPGNIEDGMMRVVWFRGGKMWLVAPDINRGMEGGSENFSGFFSRSQFRNVRRLRYFLIFRVHFLVHSSAHFACVACPYNAGPPRRSLFIEAYGLRWGKITREDNRIAYGGRELKIRFSRGYDLFSFERMPRLLMSLMIRSSQASFTHDNTQGDLASESLLSLIFSRKLERAQFPDFELQFSSFAARGGGEFRIFPGKIRIERIRPEVFPAPISASRLLYCALKSWLKTSSSLFLLARRLFAHTVFLRFYWAFYLSSSFMTCQKCLLNRNG